MKKVLVNRCYGGFGFSEEFQKHLCTKYPDLFDDELNYTGDGGWFDFRSGLIADEAIEFGLDKASGRFANLTIVEIPDGASYEIHEYDGMEHIQHTFISLNMSELVRGIKCPEQLDAISKVNFVQVIDDRPSLADSWDGDDTHHQSWGC